MVMPGSLHINMKLFVKHFKNPEAWSRSMKIAAIVGPLLAVINHYDAILSGNFSTTTVIQIVLTFVVPFAVALTSSALHGRDHELQGK